MKQGGAALVVRALEDEGIPFTFGIPGTHNLELYDALAASSSVQPLLVTDEQSAAFMADGLWRASSRLGCVNLVPGAGLTHALSGIAEAWLDAVPMLVLGCGVRRDTGRGYQLHDIDQAALARPVTKAVLTPARGGELYAMVRAACRLAREGRPGPVMVEVPAEMYLFRHDEEPAPAEPPVRAAKDELVEALAPATDLLAAARRPLLYLGLGAAVAADALVALAERLDSPVATTFQGKGVFPESHPLFLWPGFGAAAPEFVRRIAEGCDATLAIGCRFGEVATGSYGAAPPGPLVHIDIDPAVLGRNYPAKVAVAADARDAVPALLAALPPRAPDLPLRERIRLGHDALRQRWSAARGRDGIAPARLLLGLQEAFGPRAIFATDSGNGTFLAAEMLRLDGPGRFLAPVDYSCMGYAIPAAIGAALGQPETTVVALPGDGAFLMTGLELLTAASRGLRVVAVVLRDRQLGQISQFQRSAYGREACSRLPDYDLVSICEGLGVECRAISADEEVPDALAWAADAAARGRPVALDAAVDYSVGTYFTAGVVRTNFARLPWPDRLRFAARAISRRAMGALR